MWTFPEVLLGPDVALHICWKTESEIQWYELKKHEFPEKVWTDDSKRSMQMVRHYKNIALTRLEFVKIVMDCLLHRQQQKNGINWHYPGDLSYVLMGFLRIRPPINKFDSSLQAFARLSLPADNDRLMERFLCLSSDSEDANWANLTDSFAVSLWSIQPSIQISGVGENDTIIIEKALGARIELSRFSDMSAVDLSYWRRLVGISAGLMIVPPWCEMMATWFRRMKYTECLPRFYGFEGFMKLEQIEEKLFGAKPGFLSWSTNASSFSQHVPGAPVYEPKSQGSGDQGKSFAGLKFDLEAQRGARGPERESIEVDGRILTYPIIGEQPWVDCPCANSNACRCEGMTDRELRKIGQGEMGKQKVCRTPLIS